MLSVLKIENIAIIESAEIEFSKGFNVLSGETGAGKSIILDSINAVLGFRTSRELIRTGAEEARVTALFSCVGENVSKALEKLGLPKNDDGSVLISRVIGYERNVCRVNNALTNVSALREIGAELISIHGQQDNRELLNNETHISYIDSMIENQQIFTDYFAMYEELVSLKSLIKKLTVDKAEKARLVDILTYQIDEIEKSEITDGEWDRLKNRRNELLNFEKIQSAVSGAYGALNGNNDFGGAVDLVSSALRELSAVSSVSDEMARLYNKLNDVYYDLSDSSEDLRSFIDDDGYSTSELEDVENRLNVIYKLSKKYGDTEIQILEFLENAKQQLNDISFSDEKLAELNDKYEKLLAKTLEAAENISCERKSVAKVFAEKVCNELAFLDMPNVVFDVSFDKKELSENGFDTAEFLISANVGEIPKPIAKIASGGELSRIMLALKTVIAHKDKIETMIFDEIDAGVSGRAAIKVASKLKNVSVGKQVLCVTHLAQLMAFADNHYLIEKLVSDGKTYTNVIPLDREGKMNEIARIIGGGKITDIQLQNAEQLLKNASEGIF